MTHSSSTAQLSNLYTKYITRKLTSNSQDTHALKTNHFTVKIMCSSLVPRKSFAEGMLCNSAYLSLKTYLNLYLELYGPFCLGIDIFHFSFYQRHTVPRKHLYMNVYVHTHTSIHIYLHKYTFKNKHTYKYTQVQFIVML